MKQEKTPRLLKRKALAWIQMRKAEVLYTGDLQKALAITPKQEANLMSYLRKTGYLAGLIRGVSMAPNYLPVGKWLPDPYKTVSTLMQEIKADYQVTGLYAFNRYGLSNQVPTNMMAVYNTKISGKRVINGLSFRFIKVAKERLGEVKMLGIPGEKTCEIYMSSLPRTLFDAVYDWDRFATLPEAYWWIAKKRSETETIEKLVDITIQYGNVGTQRRIGFILDALKIDPALFDQLLKVLPQSKSLIPLVPWKKAQGTIDKKWGIIVNDKYPNLPAPR